MMKKRHFYKSNYKKNNSVIFLTVLFIISLIIFSYLLIVFFREFIIYDVGYSGDLYWRPQMFPDNWQPIDKIGPVEGVNVFSDVNGTKDSNNNMVSTGPNYHPQRFLHDFSYAGYHRSEKPIPPEDQNSWTKNAKIYDVTKSPYNCIPDGQSDCKPAIQKAIDDAGSSGGGIIYLPQGEYKIVSSNQFYFFRIRSNNIVIRGDGPDRTKIKVDPYMGGVFDMDNKNIFDIAYKPNNAETSWMATTSQSVNIIKDLPYPTKVIPVSDVSLFSIGDQIIIYGQYTDAFLREHDLVNIWNIGDTAYIWRRTITAVNSAKKEISIDVPTRYRVKVVEDKPVVIKTNPGLSEIGLEHFSVGMLRHPNEWPDNDDSTNPIVSSIKDNRVIYMYNVENSWIYDIKTYPPTENINRPTDNTKYGAYDVELLNNFVYLKDIRQVTMKNFYIKNMQVDGNPGGGYGYALQLFRTNELLIENGTFQKVKKGITINNAGTSGNVIKDINYKEIFTTQNDFHSYLSSSNLIENNFVDGTYWEAAVRPIDLLSTGGVNHGHGTTQTVFWNIRGARLTIPILTWWDRDNDNNKIRDELEPHGELPDEGIIVSNQYGWGYIIGTYGSFSDVITAEMSDRIADINGNGKTDDDPYRPYILPRDYKEGIGYDKPSSNYYGKALCPRSLYEAQLSLRLKGEISLCTNEIVCQDNDSDGYSDNACGGNDCNDQDPLLNLNCDIVQSQIIIDNLDFGFSSQNNWQTSRASNSYGANSLYSAIIGDTATWNAVILPGVYEIYVWWTHLPSRSQNAPYKIFNGNNLLDTIRVNQNDSSLAGKWNLLGEYEFSQQAKVTLTVEGGGSYSSDAVMLIRKRDLSHDMQLLRLIIESPENRTYKNTPVQIKFSGFGASLCWYVFNSVRTDTSCDFSGFIYPMHGIHNITAFIDNSTKQISEKREFNYLSTRRFIVKYSNFTKPFSMTSRLDDLNDSQLSSVKLILDDISFAKIEFLDYVDLSAAADPLTYEIDLDSNVITSFNKIDLKSDKLASLNKRARLTLKGLKLLRPVIFKDGIICTDCLIESYTDGNLVFNVSGFSVYSAQEYPESGVNPDNNEGSNGGSSYTGGGSEGGLPVESKNEKNNQVNVGLNKKRQEIFVSDEAVYFTIKNNEEFIINVNGDLYDSLFKIIDGRTILKISENEYELAKGALMIFDIGNYKVFGALKDSFSTKGVIGISLSKDNLQKSLGEIYAKDRRNLRYILIVLLLALAAAISLISIYLIRSWRLSNKQMEKEQQWTKEKRFVIKEEKGREF